MVRLLERTFSPGDEGANGALRDEEATVNGPNHFWRTSSALIPIFCGSDRYPPAPMIFPPRSLRTCMRDSVRSRCLHLEATRNCCKFVPPWLCRPQLSCPRPLTAPNSALLREERASRGSRVLDAAYSPRTFNLSRSLDAHMHADV